MGTESKKRVDLCIYINDSEIIFLDTHTHTYIYIHLSSLIREIQNNVVIYKMKNIDTSICTEKEDYLRGKELPGYTTKSGKNTFFFPLIK